eukprot:scaffold803_cov367-Pavlova_lutheri.AAC.11
MPQHNHQHASSVPPALSREALTYSPSLEVVSSTYSPVYSGNICRCSVRPPRRTPIGEWTYRTTSYTCHSHITIEGPRTEHPSAPSFSQKCKGQVVSLQTLLFKRIHREYYTTLGKWP